MSVIECVVADVTVPLSGTLGLACQTSYVAVVKVPEGVGTVLSGVANVSVDAVLLWMVVGTWLLIHYIALDVAEYPS